MVAWHCRVCCEKAQEAVLIPVAVMEIDDAYFEALLTIAGLIRSPSQDLPRSADISNTKTRCDECILMKSARQQHKGNCNMDILLLSSICCRNVTNLIGLVRYQKVPCKGLTGTMSPEQREECPKRNEAGEPEPLASPRDQTLLVCEECVINIL